jgi:hypothetical protein
VLPAQGIELLQQQGAQLLLLLLLLLRCILLSWLEVRLTSAGILDMTHGLALQYSAAGAAAACGRCCCMNGGLPAPATDMSHSPGIQQLLERSDIALVVQDSTQHTALQQTLRVWRIDSRLTSTGRTHKISLLQAPFRMLGSRDCHQGSRVLALQGLKEVMTVLGDNS